MVRKTKELRLLAKEIRKDIIVSLAYAKTGHTAGSLGMTDVFTTLYFGGILNHNPKKPNDPNRDRLFLSNGHICPVLYTTLAHAGYFPKKELATLRKLNSRLQGHPHFSGSKDKKSVKQQLPGVENSGGPLGQGISMAVGSALAAKLDNKQHKIFCGMSDGELQEGQAWEAFMFAASHKLDNLVVFLDRNNIQIDGTTDEIHPSLHSVAKKLKSFGWEVYGINGHDIPMIQRAFKQHTPNKPLLIICHTVPGKGVSFMEHKFEWHGKVPNHDEAEDALNELQ